MTFGLVRFSKKLREGKLIILMPRDHEANYFHKNRLKSNNLYTYATLPTYSYYTLP